YSQCAYYFPLCAVFFSIFLFFSFCAPLPPHFFTLSLHDALPISTRCGDRAVVRFEDRLQLFLGVLHVSAGFLVQQQAVERENRRSEEHTSELQSHLNLVCRLLLEKKKKKTNKQ